MRLFGARRFSARVARGMRGCSGRTPRDGVGIRRIDPREARSERSLQPFQRSRRVRQRPDVPLPDPPPAQDRSDDFDVGPREVTAERQLDEVCAHAGMLGVPTRPGCAARRLGANASAPPRREGLPPSVASRPRDPTAVLPFPAPSAPARLRRTRRRKPAGPGDGMRGRDIVTTAAGRYLAPSVTTALGGGLQCVTPGELRAPTVRTAVTDAEFFQKQTVHGGPGVR